MSDYYQFVQVNEFRPNQNDAWKGIGQITNWTKENDTTILLTNADGKVIQLSFLSPTALRVRFNPSSNDFSNNNSFAVVNRDLGSVSLSIEEGEINGFATLFIKTDVITVHVGLAPYGIAVYKGEQLIHSDVYGKNLVYNGEMVANLKKSPSNEAYYGFGEKAGAELNKRGFTMTFFNYDNFTYGNNGDDGYSMVPNQGKNYKGVLDPRSPLYNSMPFCLTVGKPTSPSPSQSREELYSYGLFFDNVSQSYFNMETNDYYSDMTGKYYFGALFGDLDYYLLVGDEGAGSVNVIADVMAQYSQLTGSSAMPPKYALGYQQGCYGYYDEQKLMEAATKYRENKIPIDGLHIDVDFQDNYRTFTHSKRKFPNPKQMFENLHNMGFKCSTNITGIVTSNPMDEYGKTLAEGGAEYPTRDEIVELAGNKGQNATLKSNAPIDPFIYNTRNYANPSSDLFIAQESYGAINSHSFVDTSKFSPSPEHPEGSAQLGTYGYYADMGREDVQEWWGKQYKDLLLMGLDMVWQDMTCPAVAENFDNNYPYKTLPLNVMMVDKRSGEYVPNALVHNSFAINLIEATYAGLTKLRASEEFEGTYNYKKRNFIIARGGYAGVHRSAAIWTGDSASSWDFLAINIPEILNIGLTGQPLSGSDVGGFASGSGSEGDGITNYQLFTRWMTSAAFLPWYRNHYDGYNKLFQEPYKYGEPVPTNCRKYIELRYRLIQVFYDAMFENTVNGMPIARALFLNDPLDPQVYNHLNDQFFVGENILVAPAIGAGEVVYRDVYLPKGSNWHVFNDLTTPLAKYNAGGTTQHWAVGLDLVPVYVRSGAIVPLRGLEQYIGELDENPITFQIYGVNSYNPRKGGSHTLYQDDETTTAAQEEQAYRLTEINHSHYNGNFISIERTYDKYTPKEKYFFVAFMDGYETTPSITKDGSASDVARVQNRDELNAITQDASYFDAELNTLFIKVFDTATNIGIRF